MAYYRCAADNTFLYRIPTFKQWWVGPHLGSCNRGELFTHSDSDDPTNVASPWYRGRTPTDVAVHTFTERSVAVQVDGKTRIFVKESEPRYRVDLKQDYMALEAADPSEPVVEVRRGNAVVTTFALHLCTELRLFDVASELLTRKGAVMGADGRGLTPLHIATLFDCPAVLFMQLYLDAGADPNLPFDGVFSMIYISDKLGDMFLERPGYLESSLVESPTHAIWARHYYFKRLVLTNCPKRTTMLHVLAARGHATAVEVLLHYGADPTSTDGNGLPACCKALYSLPTMNVFFRTRKINIGVIRLLLNELIRLELFCNAFIVAYMHRHQPLIESTAEAVGLSLQVHSFPNYIVRELVLDTYKRILDVPPMHLAVRFSPHVFLTLVHRGFSVDVDEDGNTLFHSLMESPTINATLVPILARFCDINAVNKAKRTFLHHEKLTPAVLEAAFECGFTAINVRDLNGNTPLHNLLKHPEHSKTRVRLVQAFAKHGANKDLRNKQGESSMDLALEADATHALKNVYVDAVLHGVPSAVLRVMMRNLALNPDFTFDSVFVQYSVLLKRNIDEVVRTLSTLKDISYYYPDGLSLYTIACLNGLPDVVRALEYRRKDNYVWTPLQAAAVSGSTDTLDLVLTHAPLSMTHIPLDWFSEETQHLGNELWRVTDSTGRTRKTSLTPLAEAIARCHVGCVRMLLPFSDLLNPDFLDRNALDWACMAGPDVLNVVFDYMASRLHMEDLARLIFRRGNGVAKQVVYLGDPSLKFTWEMNTPTVNWLLEHALDKVSPLCSYRVREPIPCGWATLVQTLIKRRMFLDILAICQKSTECHEYVCLGKGVTVFMTCAMVGDMTVIKGLWECFDEGLRRACVEHRTVDGLTVFHLASPVASDWLARKSDKDVMLWRDRMGRTPLHYSVSNRFLYCTYSLDQTNMRVFPCVTDRMFIAKDCRDHRGFTALDYAVTFSNTDMVQALHGGEK